MFQLTGYLTGFSSLKDGGASIRFATQELSPDDFATLHKAQNAFGWLVFKENEVTLQDIPVEHAEDKNKTPSKRLRATLFVLWRQEGEPMGSFEAFYADRMEKLIDHVKSKLD